MIGHLMLVRRILESEPAESAHFGYAPPRVFNLQASLPASTEVLAWEAVAS